MFYRNLSLALAVVIAGLFPFLDFSSKSDGANQSAVCDSEVKAKPPAHIQNVNLTIQAVVFILISVVLMKLYKFCHKEYLLSEKIRKKPGAHFDMAEYFFYRVDYLFSKSSNFKIIALLFVTSFLIVIGGLFVWIANIISTDLSAGEMPSMSESIWAAWTFIADPGTHADSDSGTLRVVSLILTLGGMVIFALVISIVSEDVGNFVENLRKGKSRVVESGHTLIIGQGDKLIPTVKQICLANESEGGGLIVILTTLPKEEIEVELAASQIDTKGTDVVVRSGFPHMESDLKKVGTTSARSIIVLANRIHSDTDSADVDVARIVLGIRAMMAGSPSECSHITCDVCDIDNEELISLVGEGMVETVVSHDIVGRLMLQCSLRTGLSLVLDALLGFEGDEFYISPWPELVGQTFGQIMFQFKDAIVIGLLRYDVHVDSDDEDEKEDNAQDGEELSGGGVILLNPPMDTLIGPRDKIIVIAEDNDSYYPLEEPEYVDWDRCQEIKNPDVFMEEQDKPVKILLVGWRRDMADMIEQVNDYVPKHSQLTILSNLALAEREERLALKGFGEKQLNRISINHIVANPTLRKDLERIQLASFHSILILADEMLESSGDMAHADSKSLTSLILIRDIQMKQKEHIEMSQTKHRVFRGYDADELGATNSGPSHSKRKSASVHRSIRHSVSTHGSSNASAGIRSNSSVPSVPMLNLSAHTAFSASAGPSGLGVFRSGRSDCSDDSGDSTPRKVAVTTPYSSGPGAAYAGSESFTSLLRTLPDYSCLVSEILDSRTKAVASVASVYDYVASNEIISMILAMVCEQREVNSIFKELFSAKGNEIFLHAAVVYIKPNCQASFFELQLIGKLKRHLIIGYLDTQGEGVVLNPRDKSTIKTWSDDLLLIVLHDHLLA